jgi:hypothetical protein
MGRKKLFGIAVLLSLLLIFPLALGANVINLGDLPFFGGPVTSSSTTVFADPPHVLNEALQAGNKFTVHLNVSEVSDLFTWQISMNWNSSILNISRIIPNEFLARSVNDTSSEALGDIVINATDNAQGHGLFAESILANVSGIPGPANGRLVSIEFLVLDYGWTDLNISSSGDFPATLLDSAGNELTFTGVNGYFSNKMPGDIDGDKDVDPDDFSSFRVAYGSKGPPQVPTPDPGYNRQADFDLDGDTDPDDFSTFRVNYGRIM